jgi:hypothetical protein
MRSCSVLGLLVLVSDWIELKKPRSRTLKSGELAGCWITLIYKEVLDTVRANSLSLGRICGLALSCWMWIVCPISSAGQTDLIAISTLSIRNSLFTFLLAMIFYVSSIPLGRLPLFLAAGTSLSKGQTPFFPGNVTLPALSNLGLATTVRNITFPIRFFALNCSCRVRFLW